ncbi:MAG: iron-sulfur cluster repair di-iron protein [Bacteroidaceae bacterium]
MKIDEKTIIGDVVAANYTAADVFHNHGIDFCCNGNRPISEAIKGTSITLKQLEEELETKRNFSEKGEDYRTWELGFLADYIFNAHHNYIRTQAPIILEYLDKVCAAHGENHPELSEVRNLFRASFEDLSAHLQKEEMILFPMIKEYEKNSKLGIAPEENHCGTINNPIAQMMSEHDAEGSRFRTISKLTNHYTVPEDGCNAFAVTMNKLKDYEANLHKHIHLENNILFPNAVILEEKIKGTC